MLNKLLSDYHSENPEKFNEDFIYLRRKDNIKSYIEYNCRALEIISGIKFLGCEIIEDESQFPQPRNFISVEDSRFILVELSFRIKAKVSKNEKEEKVEDVKLRLFFPRLVNEFFYRINGATYSAIYQLVDSSTYSTNKTFTLKTLFMPIIFRTDQFTEVMSNQEMVINNHIFVLDAFKQRNNLLYYYFAKFGFIEALDYMGLEYGSEFVVSSDPEYTNDSGDVYHSFQITKSIFLHFHESLYDEGENNEDALLVQYYERLTCSIVDVFERNRINLQRIFDEDYWMKILGKSFTKNSNAQEEKAKSVLLSLERVLDECTRSNLVDIDSEDKEDIYAIMRHLVLNFDSHLETDNMELTEKRIRLNEYIIYPVILKFTQNVYRLINSKNVTFGKLKTIFSNFGNMFAIKKLTTSKLLRYSNAVNQMDLYAAGLKFTKSGPQSMGDGDGSNVSVRYRGLHPSYVGRVELVAASAGEPGMTGTFTPFCQMDKTNPFYFSKDLDLEKKS